MAEAVIAVEDIFSKLFRNIAERFDRDIEVPESLERKLNSTVAEIKEETSIATRERVIKFADAIEDFNPVHRDADYAQRIYGFEKPIIPGTMIASLGEQYILEVNRAFEGTLGTALVITEMRVPIPNPIYIDQAIRWQVKSAYLEENDIGLQVTGANRKRHIIIGPINARFSRNYSGISKKEDIAFSVSEDHVIDEERLSNFYDSLGEKSFESVPWGYVSGLSTSILLKVSQQGDGKPSGLNRRMSFQFFREPKLGSINVGLYLKKMNYISRVMLYSYSVGSIFSQDEKIISTGEINVVSDKEICLP